MAERETYRNNFNIKIKRDPEIVAPAPLPAQNERSERREKMNEHTYGEQSTHSLFCVESSFFYTANIPSFA